MTILVSDVITAIGSVLTQLVSWISSFLGILTSNPLTMVIIGVLIVSTGVGFMFKLLKGV
jgi:hypothetical protein